MLKQIFLTLLLLFISMPGMALPDYVYKDDDYLYKKSGIPYPEQIFAHYDEWPPESITDNEVDILRELVCVLDTSKGEIRIELYPDAAPLHCANFVKLIQEGFYDGLTFHRVIEDFMSQGGDPEGTGAGGPGYTVPAEIGLPHEEGSLAAARIGDAVNPKRASSGSQFYLVHTDESCIFLDGNYTVFGKIIEGADINRALNITYTAGGPIPGVQPDIIVGAWVELPELQDE